MELNIQRKWNITTLISPAAVVTYVYVECQLKLVSLTFDYIDRERRAPINIVIVYTGTTRHAIIILHLVSLIK